MITLFWVFVVALKFAAVWLWYVG